VFDFVISASRVLDQFAFVADGLMTLRHLSVSHDAVKFRKSSGVLESVAPPRLASRVPVRSSGYNRLRCDVAAGAGAIINDKGLVETLTTIGPSGVR
jgi:hypothetical protein